MYSGWISSSAAWVAGCTVVASVSRIGMPQNEEIDPATTASGQLLRVATITDLRSGNPVKDANVSSRNRTSSATSAAVSSRPAPAKRVTR
jgi:hypothetical protein